MNVQLNPGGGFKSSMLSADMKKGDKLQAACKDFEALMIKQMLTIMRQSVPEGGLFSGGYAEQTYRSMQDDELAKGLADSGGMGFGDMLYRQLSGQLQKTTQKG